MEQLGQYKILRKLGAGAMGEVYLAEQLKTGHLFAVKILPSQLASDQKCKERLRSEAKVMASLRHPNVVRIYTLGVEKDTQFIVMDFVTPDGKHPKSLEDLIRERGGRLTPGEVATIFTQICRALAYCHKQGIVHCDIKPANILLDKGGNVKISDFGLAKIIGAKFIQQSILVSLSGSLGAAKTLAIQHSAMDAKDSIGISNTLDGGNTPHTESLVGTYNYMPPEVIKGGGWSEAGDIYSLGVLMYRLLTGKLPIGKWDLPSTIYSDIPEFWDLVLEQALSANVEERFKSIDEFVAACRYHSSQSNDKQKPQQWRQKLTDAATRLWASTIDTIAETKTAIAVSGFLLLAVVGSFPVIHYLKSESRLRQTTNETGCYRGFSGRYREGTYPGEGLSLEIVNGLKLELVWIPPGKFLMGSTESEKERNKDEALHEVILTRGFWIGKYEAQEALWKKFMSIRSTPLSPEFSFPVDNVENWKDCQTFFEKLNDTFADGTFRLPTEAEWEYACRAGTSSRFFWGEDNDYTQIDRYAWYFDNSNDTGPSGMKAPNAWGLYDMSGNVWEWCQDFYGEYPTRSVRNPTGPKESTHKVIRGGSIANLGQFCRSAARCSQQVKTSLKHVGFRIVWSS